MPSRTAVVTTFRQAVCALSDRRLEVRRQEQVFQVRLLASNASLMRSRNTARMMQPPRHSRAIAPNFSGHLCSAAAACICTKPWA